MRKQSRGVQSRLALRYEISPAPPPPPAATIGLTSKGPKSPSRLADGKKKERIKPAAVALPMRCSLTPHPSDAPCRTSVFNISNTLTKLGSKKKKKKTPPNITLSYSDFALQPLTSACVAAVSGHSTKKKETSSKNTSGGGRGFQGRRTSPRLRFLFSLHRLSYQLHVHFELAVFKG